MEPVSDEKTERVPSPADIAFLEAIELAVDERSAYPDGAEFIDSERPWVGKTIAEAAAEGRAVVLCTPDGRRLVLQPPRPAAA
jgi:hypothetical protein